MRSLILKGSNLCASVARRHASRTTTGVTFASVGQPSDVLKYGSEVSVPELGANDVALKILASPINPADLNFVEGIYGNKATKFPAIPGGEGVAKVVQVGAGVSNLRVGDWVIPAGTGFGCWRTDAVSPASEWLKVPSDIPAAYASTLLVNPCTSYRLITDFGDLKEGDWLIQNGANSMVGLGVIQMARERGIKTINIIRHDRPEAENTLRLVTNYGGDINILDDYLTTQGFQDIVDDIHASTSGRLKLGLNTVGGDSAANIARVLAPNATLVTYGAMSRTGVRFPADVVMQKQLELKGFWMSAWHEANKHSSERRKMIDDIVQLIKDKQLSYNFELHDFDDFSHALKAAQEPFRLRKVVLNMDYPDRLAEHDAKTAEDYKEFELPCIIHN